MSVLNEILLNHKPREWEAGDYSSDCHLRFTLGRYDTEYQTIANHFSGINISRIERIQNPYVLGRFLLRKEQLKLRNGHVTQRTVFHPVVVQDLKTAVDYNCDVRRYTHQAAVSDRKPKFYDSAANAKIELSSYSSEKTILVVDILAEVSYSSYTVPSTDTEYWPKYVVYIE